MNGQTKALRKRGLSLRFNKGIDFSGERNRRDPNPEFELVNMGSQKTGKGNPVNSTQARKARGKKPYRAPSVFRW